MAIKTRKGWKVVKPKRAHAKKKKSEGARGASRPPEKKKSAVKPAHSKAGK